MFKRDSASAVTPSPIVPTATKLTRRRAMQAGAAGAGALAVPYFFSRRASAATKLSFWQFYSPGGQVKTQDDWFQSTVKAWNDQNDVQIELSYVPNADYVSGSKLQTAFASGQGPDI